MKKAVMYGAGNIGRGFIGQLFSQSGYEVVFIDINETVIERLNLDGRYPVKVVSDAGNHEILVENVRGVNGKDVEKVMEEIAEADIMATAVGVNVLPRIARPVAMGLARRWRQGKREPLNIIICENLLDAHVYLAELVKRELEEEDRKLFDERVGMVEASIGRMVPIMTPAGQAGNPLRVCVEEYCELPVDREAFKGDIPQIHNMIPDSPFDFYIQRKLFIHNMGHALTAYLGYLKGYRFIWEAIGDPYIQLTVLKAMQDSAVALSREHGMPLDTLLDYVDDLVDRFGNRQLEDTVVRVGSDTKRKLAPQDRFLGAAGLCLNHRLFPVHLCLGIAAALRFNPEPGSDRGEVAEMLEQESLDAVLARVCGLSGNDRLAGIVSRFYSMLVSGMELDNIMEAADKWKRGKVG